MPSSKAMPIPIRMLVILCLPSKEVVLQTQDADYYYFKSDILAGQVSYSTDKNVAANVETITAQRAKDIIEMNRHGEKPLSLLDDGKQRENKGHTDLLAGGDINRFDKAKKKKKKKKPQGGRPEDDAATASPQPKGEGKNEPKGESKDEPKGERVKHPRGNRPPKENRPPRRQKDEQ